MTKTLSRVVSDSNRRMICEFAIVRVVSSLARRVPPRIVDEFPKRVFCCLAEKPWCRLYRAHCTQHQQRQVTFSVLALKRAYGTGKVRTNEMK